MNHIRLIWTTINRKQKRKLIVLLLLTIIGAFMELLGVSLIMPFVNIAVSPESIQGNVIVEKIYLILNIKSTNQFMIFLAIMLVVVYVIKNVYLIFLYNMQFKFTYQNQKNLEGKLLASYLRQPYEFHLSNNSADLQRNILQDVTGFFQSVLAYLQMFTEGCVCIILFLYLLYLDKTITLGVVLLLSAFVMVFYGIFKKKIGSIGVKSRFASAKRVQWVQQSLGGIKEIKILGREKFFLDSYDKNAESYADKQRKYQLATVIPRPTMETLCISSLLIIVAIKLARGVDVNYFIPTLSVFAIAAFRLLPSFSRISGYMGIIVFQKSAVEKVYEDLQSVEKLSRNQDQTIQNKETIQFLESIYLDKVSFQYPNSSQQVLRDIQLEIPKNSSVALIGPSGAGKTTLADIILGILQPTEGNVCVDGIDIRYNLEGWNKKLGYIPQNIYLMDDTIRNNIAFGIPEDEIDDEKVLKAIKEAQLMEYYSSLEEGLDSFIGERGVRLSGGQRQRIGIARALYSDPEILVLDEATSALDHDTERAIMEAIAILQGNKTLIIIAHRLTTIQNCDYIYEIKESGIRLTNPKGES